VYSSTVAILSGTPRPKPDILDRVGDGGEDSRTFLYVTLLLSLRSRWILGTQNNIFRNIEVVINTCDTFSPRIQFHGSDGSEGSDGMNHMWDPSTYGVERA
jgi:hypothetical protein